MSTSTPGAQSLLMVLGILSASLYGGCACGPPLDHACQPCFAASYVGPCFGYHGTCWNAWPGDCPPCPTFAVPGHVMEYLPAAAPDARDGRPQRGNEPPQPMPPPTAEPQSWIPAPPPAVTLAPVISPGALPGYQDR